MMGAFTWRARPVTFNIGPQSISSPSPTKMGGDRMPSGSNRGGEMAHPEGPKGRGTLGAGQGPFSAWLDTGWGIRYAKAGGRAQAGRWRFPEPEIRQTRG